MFSLVNNHFFSYNYLLFQPTLCFVVNMETLFLHHATKIKSPIRKRIMLNRPNQRNVSGPNQNTSVKDNLKEINEAIIRTIPEIIGCLPVKKLIFLRGDALLRLLLILLFVCLDLELNLLLGDLLELFFLFFWLIFFWSFWLFSIKLREMALTTIFSIICYH